MVTPNEIKKELLEDSEFKRASGMNSRKASDSDDILDDDDYLEYYMLTKDDNTFGIKKLKEKWVEVEHYSEIADAASEDDKDCVRDYYIRQMSSNKLYFSLFGLILFALALL